MVVQADQIKGADQEAVNNTRPSTGPTGTPASIWVPALVGGLIVGGLLCGVAYYYQRRVRTKEQLLSNLAGPKDQSRQHCEIVLAIQRDRSHDQ